MANFFKATAKKKLPVQHIVTKIKKLDLHGCGVAYIKKKPVFIAGALEDELVNIKIIEQKNKFYRAKLLDVVDSHPYRIKPKCHHFSICGGCDLQHIDCTHQLNFKQRKVSELFSRENIKGQLPWRPPITGSAWNYRRKARIGVQFDKNNKAIIGFRQKATNQLVAIKSCPVLVEPLADIFPLLKSILSELTVKSAIGHIEVIFAASACNHLHHYEEVTLVVRQLKPLNSEDIGIWVDFSNKNQWHVIIDDGNTKQNLTDLQSITTNSRGLKTLNYTLLNDLSISFGVSDFIQVNQQVNVSMVQLALVWLEINSRDNVLDLFCGLGNFSLAIAQQAGTVIGVEGVQVMADKANENALNNNINNCRFYQADLNSDWSSQEWFITTKKMHSPHSFDKALLDPARAGAEQAVHQLAKLVIPTIIYVSCDPVTLARDSEILISQGYKISKISLIDMFSQTKHVETMVLFNR